MLKGMARLPQSEDENILTAQASNLKVGNVCFGSEADMTGVAMSALPPKADMVHHDRDVRFVPKADSCTAAKAALIRSPRRRWRASLTAPRCRAPAPSGG
jgi:hypothetical protein